MSSLRAVALLGLTAAACVAEPESLAPPYHPSLEELLRPTCEAACAAADPQTEPDPNPDCDGGRPEGAWSCTFECLAAVEDTDLRCGACLIEHISWWPYSCYVSSWEGVCDPGGANFPWPHSDECADACADVIEESHGSP